MIDKQEVEFDTTLAEHTRPWLWGFWNEENNTSLRPCLVHGNVLGFDEDIAKAKQRQVARLDALENYRWLIVEEWDQWWTEVANGSWD